MGRSDTSLAFWTLASLTLSMKRPGYKLLWGFLSLVLGAAAAAESPASAAADAAEAGGGSATPEGRVQLSSGLSYRILEAGRGEQPTLSDVVALRFRATTLEGREVDSSGEGRPTRLRVSQAMPAWREALPMMREGARWELVVPPGLGYTRSRGTHYTRPEGPLTHEKLIFELELLEVQERKAASFASLTRRAVRRPGRSVPHVFVYLMGDAEPASEGAPADSAAETPLAITTETLAARQAAPTQEKESGPEPAAGRSLPGAAEASAESSTAASDGESGTEAPAATVEETSPAPTGAPADIPLIVLESGLRYRIARNGGGLAPVPGDTISFAYRQTSAEGPAGADAWRREGQVTLPLEAVGPAWRAVFRRMEEGARWQIQVPHVLAPGPWGAPRGEAVAAEVELMAVGTAPPQGLAPTALELSGAPEGDSVPARAGGPALIDLPGGIRYRVLSRGGGDRPGTDDIITLRFTGTLVDGDTGYGYYTEGEARFPPGEAGATWQDVFRGMREGAQWELYLPSELMRDPWGPPAGHTVLLGLELRSVEAPGRRKGQ
jgi:FKBP-type peptidyl-prolyl cis-trans isomerase